jgi:hypothetical protein
LGQASGALLLVAALLLAAAPASADPRSGWWSRTRAAMAGLPGQGAVTQREAEQGLKEGLEAAAGAAAQRVGAPDGFLGNPDIKIALPRSLEAMRQRLTIFGRDEPLSALEIEINRAAEASAPAIEALLIAEIRGLTIDDALGVLRGGEDAGTVFLRQRLDPALAAKLLPEVEAALEAAGAFAALEELGRSMPMRGLAGDLKRDLTDYVLEKAIEGAFHVLAEEEAALRRNPALWTTALLKRVFGGV